MAGIIGASYDNTSTQAGRSLGVSGGNPVARIHAVSYKKFRSRATVAGHVTLAEDIVEVFDLVLSKAESNDVPNLRVLNYSAGGRRERRRQRLAERVPQPNLRAGRARRRRGQHELVYAQQPG